VIRRVEYEVTVDGASETSKGFDDVEAAEKRAANAAGDLSRQLDRVETSQKSIATSAPKVGVAFDGVRDKLGSTLTVFNDLGDAMMLLGAGLAGGALFGGLADIAEVVGLLGDKLGITAMRVDALSAAHRTLSSELVARKFEVENIGNALDQYARSLGLASAAQLTFRERQEALRQTAAGNITTMEIQDRAAERANEALVTARQRLDEYLRDRTRFIGEITRAGGEQEFEAALRGRITALESELAGINRRQLGLLGRPGADPFMESAKAYGQGLVSRMRAGVQAVSASLSEQYQRFNQVWSEAQGRASGAAGGAGGGARPAPSLADVVGGIAGAPSPRRAMESEALAGIDRELAAGAPTVEQADAVLVGMQQHAMMAGHAMQTVQAEAVKTRDIMAEMWTGTKDAFGGMAESAMNVGGIVVQALSTMTGAVGSMMTNIIISGEAGAKGVAKAAGNALAGISAQAFGYSVLLGALAAAASLAGPILGLQAGGFAAAAGVMAAAGGGLAVTARLLGADRLGGGAAGRGGAGTSPGGYGAATATNPYGGPGQQGTTVQVYIDGEQVTRAVRVREQRMALSGGIMGGA
jgi:hypothetical protein